MPYRYTLRNKSGKVIETIEYRTTPFEVLFRFDTRPPDIISKVGFKGSCNNDWWNVIFGSNTVYCAKSMLGVLNYRAEMKKENPNPQKTGNDRLKSSFTASTFSKVTFQGKELFLYKINAIGLHCVDVVEDMGLVKYTTEHGTTEDRYIDPNEAIPESLPSVDYSGLTKHRRLEEIRHFNSLPRTKQLEMGRMYDLTDIDAIRAEVTGNYALHNHWYASGIARYTQEVIVEGPITPDRISVRGLDGGLKGGEVASDTYRQIYHPLST